jgi:3-dehydroquinate synthase
MPDTAERRDTTRIAANRTDVIRQNFAVAFEYPVYFTEGVFHPDNTVLTDALSRREPTRRHRVVAFADAGVVALMPQLGADLARYADWFRDRMALAAPLLTVPGGEAAKNDPSIVAAIQKKLHDLGIDRQAHVVAIGGGAVLDMVGYAAAATHRGVRLVRVPTTVLAQNDSGVGVKTAINAFGAKNFLGSFAPPFAVINDFDFIRHLPPRDRLAGMAEAVKVALIRDEAFFIWLERGAEDLARFEDGAMRSMIRRCAELHLRHIAEGGDPFEFGSARPLDFGHWAAHKLEGLSGYALRHGEAVAIGIALDSRYSAETGLLDIRAAERICALLERLGFPLWHDTLDLRAPDGSRRALQGLAEFREHLGGELTVTLLAGIGRGIEVNSIDTSVVARCIDWLKARHAARR